MKTLAFGIAGGLSLVLASSAMATPTLTADSVTRAGVGAIDGSPSAGFDDPDNAIADDGLAYALGDGGSLTIKIDPASTIKAGILIETTTGERSNWIELAYVEFLDAGMGSLNTPVLIDNIANDGKAMVYFDPALLGAKYMVITDATTDAGAQADFLAVYGPLTGTERFGPTFTNPGFDVQAVSVVVPSPAAAAGGIGLLGALAAGHVARRRRQG